MTRHLLIMRHAKSASNTNAKTDFDRPLGKHGIRDAPRMGRRLRKQGLAPDHVVRSPAERAKQTALKACQAMRLEKRQITWDGPVYYARPLPTAAVAHVEVPGSWKKLRSGKARLVSVERRGL